MFTFEETCSPFELFAIAVAAISAAAFSRKVRREVTSTDAD
jgi:hypothetical protein